jgi:hypothetical protein
VEQEVHQCSLELGTWQYGDIIGYKADGYLGQYLVILPRAELVATRMIRRKPDYNPDTDGFEDFVDCIRSMAERDEEVASRRLPHTHRGLGPSPGSHTDAQ